MLVLWICVGDRRSLVFGAMAYALVAFRKKEGVKPATWDHSTVAEIVWTVIPVFILVAHGHSGRPHPGLHRGHPRLGADHQDHRLPVEMELRVRGPGVSFYSNLARTSNVARQLNSGIDPNSVEHYLLEVDRPLVLPAGVKIRYLLTSNDVNHAWWVQAFGVKRDAIAGYINEGWFKVDEPGTYRGQCAELCGKDHGFMPIVVEVLPKAEFEAWLAEQKNGSRRRRGGASGRHGGAGTMTAAERPRSTTMITNMARRRASCAGSRRPTTRTSARFT